jgi:hypothetical protein
VVSGLALEAEVVVAAAAPTAFLLKSDQLLELLGSASRTFAQWSSGVAVANAVAELPLPGVPAALAEHASHLCACSQTSVETTHIKSDSAVFQHKKKIYRKLHSIEQLIIFTDNFSDKEESGNKWITQLNN